MYEYIKLITKYNYVYCKLIGKLVLSWGYVFLVKIKYLLVRY